MDISGPAVIYEDENDEAFSQMNQFMQRGATGLQKLTCDSKEIALASSLLNNH